MAVYERDNILKDLRKGVLRVFFDDKSEARVTLYHKVSPVYDLKEEEVFHAMNPDAISAWDVFRNTWITFNINRVQYVEQLDDSQYY